MTPSHLSFSIARGDLVSRVLIPKFYDPELAEAVRLAGEDFETPLLSELLLPGDTGSRLGTWLRREHYGSGSIPFVRTSDLSHWRVRPDVKKGVSEAVYEEHRKRQDLQPWDILFVAHGTYLVGDVALVTPAEAKLLISDHVFRLRVNPAAGVSPLLVLAALSTAFVRRQVRSRQFSADIIDKIGDRHLGLRVPIPRSPARREAVVSRVSNVVAGQDRARQAIQEASQSDLRMVRERATARHGFSVRRSSLRGRILIPKYYDPELEADLRSVEQREGPWQTLASLVDAGLLSVQGGVEVGKMAYGTGEIPFVRTSDLVDWEVSLDSKHGVSQAIYDSYAKKGRLLADDIIVVRDGTYLVGSSAWVGPGDLPALHCGGILRLRSVDPKRLSPHYLLAALNLPLVRRQMRARQFTRDVIDTLGNRLLEVRVPPLDSPFAAHSAASVAEVMVQKAKLKAEIADIIADSEPRLPPRIANRPGSSMR